MTVPAQAFLANQETDAERRLALRALLRNSLLPACGETAKDYNLVRRHSAWLKYWLGKFPAWDLHIDKEAARLRKTPPDHLDDTRRAIDATSGSPFSRRRYALLCLALAALEKSEAQTTLGRVADVIVELVSTDRDLQAAGLVFNISNQDQRRDLVHVIRLLLNFGLLRRIDGDEQQFLRRTGSADVLYEINRPILAVLLSLSRSPSAIEAAGAKGSDPSSPSSVFNDPSPPNEEARNRRIRARLVRALLDDPVLYFRDLTSEERGYLQRQSGYLLRQIQEASGLIPEVRREGMAMVDDNGDLTDLKLPEEGTDGHLGLLLTAWLAEHSRNRPCEAVSYAAVEEYVATLIRLHGAKWRKSASEPGAEARLAEDTLWRLRGLRLIRMTADGVVPLAAVGRYALANPIEGAEK